MDKLEFSDNKTYKIRYLLSEGDYLKTIWAFGKDMSVNDEGYFKVQKYYHASNNRCRFDYSIYHYIDILNTEYRVFEDSELSARYRQITEYQGDFLADTYERDEAYKMDIKKYLTKCRELTRKYIKYYRTAKWYDILFRERKDWYEEIQWHRKKNYELIKMLSECE